ncbi:unnamed protein product, partial [Nesidiocoris tenuis]
MPSFVPKLRIRRRARHAIATFLFGTQPTQRDRCEKRGHAALRQSGTRSPPLDPPLRRPQPLDSTCECSGPARAAPSRCG